MQRIKLTADSPGYLKVSNIKDELLDFTTVLNEKYISIDFIFWFCFRALQGDTIESGWKSKVTFYKRYNALSFDIIMPESEFVPYKKDIVMQRKIMGEHFFLYFKESIIKYSKKLPTLKTVAENLIEDMEIFLIKKQWLNDK